MSSVIKQMIEMHKNRDWKLNCFFYIALIVEQIAF